MDSSIYYLEKRASQRQHDLVDEARRHAAGQEVRRAARARAATRSHERALLTTAARPGAALALQPRTVEFAAECVERVAAWRRAAGTVGRSLVGVGRRLEQVGRAA